jgi:hypothetical protein
MLFIGAEECMASIATRHRLHLPEIEQASDALDDEKLSKRSLLNVATTFKSAGHG